MPPSTKCPFLHVPLKNNLPFKRWRFHCLCRFLWVQLSSDAFWGWVIFHVVFSSLLEQSVVGAGTQASKLAAPINLTWFTNCSWWSTIQILIVREWNQSMNISRQFVFLQLEPSHVWRYILILLIKRIFKAQTNICLVPTVWIATVWEGLSNCIPSHFTVY